MNNKPSCGTDSDDIPYPSPEHAQRIQFEGCECVVMSPEDYEILYGHARRLERERDEARQELENIAKANPREWGDMSDQFQAWAQNRARAAITKVKCSL